jgi:hypothetical protein
MRPAAHRGVVTTALLRSRFGRSYAPVSGACVGCASERTVIWLGTLKATGNLSSLYRSNGGAEDPRVEPVARSPEFATEHGNDGRITCLPRGERATQPHVPIRIRHGGHDDVGAKSDMQGI